MLEPSIFLNDNVDVDIDTNYNTDNEIPLRLVFLGNVDSGKTTLVSVLSKEKLDNGKGSARINVFKHPHERTTGRTSAIAMEFCRINNRKSMLIDLCGHERYLKTTLFGLNLVNPDYCILVVGANMGISKMTLEHITMALSLGYKLIICVTKIDISPDHITKATINALNKTIQKNGKKLYMMNNLCLANVDQSVINNITNDQIPLITISNVKGTGIGKLKTLIKRLPLVRKYNNASGVEFIVDDYFQLKGIGLILSGTVSKGQLSVGDTLDLGTNKNNGFSSIDIKSIYLDDNPVKTLMAGQHCTIGIKESHKKKNGHKLIVRRGMVAVDPILSDMRKTRIFTAEIFILHHQTTICDNRDKKLKTDGNGYQAIIHCNGVRQSAEIIKLYNDTGYIRCGDRVKADFRFLYHDEYITPNSKFIFREGTSRGIGRITDTVK